MKIIGKITQRVQSCLNVCIQGDTSIYIGESNLAHMKSSHPQDYEKYGNEIVNILQSPDYVGVNLTDGSLEYVKNFKIDSEHVKVAVRVSGKGKYFARSLYVLNSNRVHNFIKKGTLKKP